MRRITLLAALAATTQLSGCFFVFIPGSLIQKAADGITGAKGDHCVSSTATVGEAIAVPGGRYGTIKSLSGTSVRCTDPARPIRAEIDVT